MPKYTMTVACLDDDGGRTVQYWDITAMTASVIRASYGAPAEEVIESAEGRAKRASLDSDLIRFFPPNKGNQG